MGFESPQRKNGLKEAVAGAAALLSVNAVEAGELSSDHSQNYQIESSFTTQVTEADLTQIQDISKAIESTEEDIEEDEDIELINWHAEPIPATVLESVTMEQLAVYQEGVTRLRELARNDIDEHAAYVLVYPDGRVTWSDQDIITRMSYGNSEKGVGQIILPEELSDEVYVQIAQGAKLIKLHTHPTKQFSNESSSERYKESTRDVPPSNTDILNILYENNHVISSVEGQVITEAGGWRYGFKSKEAVQMFNEVLGIGAEILNQEHEPYIINQAELFSQAIVVKLLETGGDKRIIEMFSSLTGEEIMEKLADDPKFFSTFAEVVDPSHGLFSQGEIDTLGVSNFVEIIERISEERSSYLEKRGIYVDFDSLLLYPPDLEKSGQYVLDWAELGIYIEKLEK